MRVTLCFVLALVCLAAEATAQSTVFVIRHAEKAENAGNDPALAERGRVRAKALAETLRDAHVTAIYATEFKRTQETAAPLAKAAGLSVTIVPAAATEELIAKLKSDAGNALVVGHSNTIPAILSALGIDSPPALGESDYDNLFVVTRGEKSQLIRLHYR